MGFIKEQIAVIRDRDPAIHSDMEAILYSSFWAVFWYRIAHKLYLKKHYFLARYFSQHAARRTGIEIHPGAQIGKGFFIDHGSGVIIGETTVIGDNVTLYQGVTLGGTGKEKGKRHPTIGNNVMISTGAKVLGSFTIGDNSKIGAGSVVLEEVPPNCTVVGVPGRIVKRYDTTLNREELNQIDLPDPVRDDIDKLQESNANLTNHILDLEESVRDLRKELEGKTREKSRLDMDRKQTEGVNGEGI
ncbi:MAG: serine O-acetyltransferase [Lachnospiraceae bacterium]|nr:serine O-acetyltransferase [Lachnospiraceae bacterium]